MNAPTIPRRVNNVKIGIGGDLHFLSASNVLPLAALFHSDNLVEMEKVIRWRAIGHRQRRCKGRVRGGYYTRIYSVDDVNVVNCYGFGS